MSGLRAHVPRKILICGDHFAGQQPVRARAPLLELLPQKILAAQPGAVIAAHEVSAQHHLPGYWLHPALTDATLHLSAAALPTAHDSASKGPTRVPSGLEALVVTPLRGAGQAFPVAQPQVPSQDGSVLCSYRMASAQGCALQLCDLLAKELAPMPVDKASQAPVEEVPESELLYEMQWQAVGISPADEMADSADAVFSLGEEVSVDSPVGVPTAAYSSKKQGAEDADECFSAIPARSAKVTAKLGASQADNAAAAVSRMLQLWQQAAPRLSGGSLHLSVPLVTESLARGCRSDVAAAALQALVRVAAAEYPGTSVTASQHALALPAHSQKVRMAMTHLLFMPKCACDVTPSETYLRSPPPYLPARGSPEEDQDDILPSLPFSSRA